MSLIISKGASVTPLERKLAELHTNDLSNDWYCRASRILRGGDGEEHGLLLYKLILQRLDCNRPLVILDVGTARGFSSITMARALLDANQVGIIYTVDVIDHNEFRNWHSRRAGKQEDDEPLAEIVITRSEIWNKWFQDEAARITPIINESWRVLNDWNYGPIDVVFLDGDHTYGAVRKELSLLDSLMAPGGVIVLDDYHLGSSVVRIHSRFINGFIKIVVGPVFRKTWPSFGQRWRLGTDNEFMLVKQRYSGIRKAVREFLEEREDRWSLELISMPSRGDYQGDDYSLALLTRSQVGATMTKAG